MMKLVYFNVANEDIILLEFFLDLQDIKFAGISSFSFLKIPDYQIIL